MTVSLAAVTVAGVAVLSIAIDAFWATVTVLGSVSETGPGTPAGGDDVTLARLGIDPASMSDCVVV